MNDTTRAGAEASKTPGRETVTISYVPRPGLLGIAITNVLLNIVTLTIYRFWAKTKVRRHIWSCIHINGEPLEYTGTGKELFLGALIVFLVIGLPFIVVYTSLIIMFGPEHWTLVGLQGVVTLAFLLLYGMAIYRARRYRLSRTLWRGIRGTLVGSSWTYSLKTFGALLLRAITLGWATPPMNLMLESQITNDMRFGDQPFRFSGTTDPLWGRFALCWILSVLVLPLLLFGLVWWAGGIEEFLKLFDQSGTPPSPEMVIALVFGIFAFFILYALVMSILWASYTVREMNVFTSYTTYGDLKFSLAATTGSIIRLWIGNLLLVLLTFGIGQPFAIQRGVRYFCDRLSTEGTVEVAAIRQSQAAIDKRGEGLVDAFDIDAI